MYNYTDDDGNIAATAAAAGAAAAAAAEHANEYYRNHSQYSTPTPSTGVAIPNESTQVIGPLGPPEGALPSSHVGNYTLYGTIGEGAFGKVKIAVHRELNVRVAIKIMDKSEIRAQEFTAQVRREIYIMRRLKHRHIVRMHEVLTSDTKLYIVMELVTGGELFDRIEKGRVSEQIARRYFQQLVDGVDFCHKKGVAHRDLKPENLLVDENGDIKITDFGFSSMKGKDVHTWLLYTQCGTPDYCAPEIIESAKDGYSGAKVDAWSCGIILYALLCGRLPFQEQDTDKLYELILACNVRYPSVISANARDLLENLLVRDPSKRFDLAKVKRHPWFLVDYEGDDARLLKKRPFFNKNQKDLTSSNPSSPVARSHSYDHPSQHFINGTGPSSMPPSPASIDHTSEHHDSTGVPTTNTQPPREAELLDHHQQFSQNGMDSDGHMGSLHPGNSSGTATVPTLNRLREDARAMRGPTSPSLPRDAKDANVRVPTPDVHEVIRAVKDRPATPATAHSTGAVPGNATGTIKSDGTASMPNTLPNGHLHQDSLPMMSGYGSNPNSIGGVSAGVTMTSSTTSIPPNAATATWGAPSRLLQGSKHGMSVTPNALTNGSSAGHSPHEYGASLGLSSHDGVDSSSDNDSTEDYEEKPAPLLQMPNNLHARLRTPDGRPNLSALPHQKHPRHRSDLAGASTNGPYGNTSSMVDYGSASLSAIQRPRRTFARDPQNSGSVTDMRSLRTRTTSEIPNSPPVIYSPSGTNGTSYDRYRAGSPGFHALRKGFASDGSPNGLYAPSTSGNGQNAWHANSGGYPPREETTSSSPTSMSEKYSRNLWDVMCRWRGSSAPVAPMLSRELRDDLSVFVRELNQLPRPEDVTSVFVHFLLLFENGIGDVASSSYPHSHTGEEEFDEIGDESREDGHEVGLNGDGRTGLVRHPGTDISSEEEPLSWSPVAQEPNGPQISDLTRRRNISDLLNKMIKKTDMAAQRSDDGGSGETTPLTDLRELHRLMRENHGGREESNLADDLLKLMSTSEDSTTLSSVMTAPQPGQSPPPPMVKSTRSADAYTQVRYPENLMNGTQNPARPNHLRSVSGTNASLPQDYVPGRFNEPNSMPARGRNGNDRTRVSTRGEGRQQAEELGDTLGRHDNMAGSMGMHDIAYYESDKKGIMANKFRGVLQTMKAKNQRLGEHHAQFRSKVPPESIMIFLARILQTMGGTVTINKETKRKIKCELAMEDWVLHARIELFTGDDGYTTVSFRRSRADKGKTGTELFHAFFEQVYNKFRDEVHQNYSSGRLATSGMGSRRRRNDHDGARYTSDLSAQGIH